MWIVISVCILFLLVPFGVHSNHDIKITRHIYRADVPVALDGYRILQISDIHADLPNWKYRVLLRKSVMVHPDLVVVTGDCVDKIHIRNEYKVVNFLRELSDRFPLYLVSGNHEYMHRECQGFLEKIEYIGINVLHNDYVDIKCEDSTIRLLGMDDPYAIYQGVLPSKYKTPYKEFEELIRTVIDTETELYDKTIMLTHRPEFFKQYCDIGVDIVFAGHAHGGQWRIPFLGGIIAPDQGLFPKYTEGKYEYGNTTMFVSRGLGNSVIPIRLFNTPELVVVEMRHDYNDL